MIGWTLKTYRKQRGPTVFVLGLPLALVTAAGLAYETILFQSPIGETLWSSLQHGMTTWLLGVMLSIVLPLLLLSNLAAVRTVPDTAGSTAARSAIVIGALHHLLPMLVISALIMAGQTSVDPMIPIAAWLLAIAAGLASVLSNRYRRRPMAMILVLGRNAAAFGGMLVAAAAVGLILASLERTAIPIDAAQILASVAGEASWPLMVLTLIASIACSMLMPAFAAYLIITTLIGTALTTVGVADLTIHLLVLFGCLIGVVMHVLIAMRSAEGTSGSTHPDPSVTMKACR